MPTYDLVSDLPLEIESYELEGIDVDVTTDFTRLTTLVELQGGGHEGVGEDVTYDGLDQIALRDEGPTLPLAGSHTLGSFSERLGELDPFPAPPVRDVSRLYRRWAFESAALDLALRQAGRSLAQALERESRPVNFVVSMRLAEFGSEEPENAGRVHRTLEKYPRTHFKLDPTNTWSQELVDELAATGAIDSLDLKGFYSGTPVDVETDPELYRMVLEAFPKAWIEDPDVNDDTRPILEPHHERVTWDAPIHSVADIEGRPWKPRMVNIKPSRFGSIRSLFEAYDYCESQSMGAYGGGQFELGQGRGQIQYLASLFHPDTPNDTAPGGYNIPDLPDGLPQTPLDPRPDETGFRWLG